MAGRDGEGESQEIPGVETPAFRRRAVGDFPGDEQVQPPPREHDRHRQQAPRDRRRRGRRHEPDRHAVDCLGPRCARKRQQNREVPD